MSHNSFTLFSKHSVPTISPVVYLKFWVHFNPFQCYVQIYPDKVNVSSKSKKWYKMQFRIRKPKRKSPLVPLWTTCSASAWLNLLLSGTWPSCCHNYLYLAYRPFSFEQHLTFRLGPTKYTTIKSAIIRYTWCVRGGCWWGKCVWVKKIPLTFVMKYNKLKRQEVLVFYSQECYYLMKYDKLKYKKY